MLEVVGLKKVYKTKNGADVNALDGVTLRFPETGMVFLLGKSGSGKSTLLNVCGGLDSPTEGEIIVKGRSSKAFSQSDFDSYRNTFVGFIFQEYNILNEFSVEDNIALALELQGKPKDKAAINALLEEVDLKGFAKRKPNTLSGGQKQRIAIARALVKAPEIIMADEPTGALDSNTGKQVFETLKKLSQNKLVIVVSHDRDFAEQYGDRIIELKDGKVLSDVSKTQLSTTPLSENINTVGDLLCIKKGSDLNEKDFEKIKAFLKKNEGDVIIAGDSKDISAFKKVSRINDEGEKEVFGDTDTSAAPKREWTKEESRFIRSKLPIKHAFKIGVSGLKHKPVRLVFTILLCTVAFTLFGLLSTLNFYDSEATFKQTMADHDSNILQLEKEFLTTITHFNSGTEEFTYETFYSAKWTDAELREIAGKLSSNAFGAVESSGNFSLRQIKGLYWHNYLNSFAFLPEDSALRGSISGQYPAAKGEIAISSYCADMLMECSGFDSDGKVLEINSREELIGKKISLSGVTYKITGIFDSGAIPPEFDYLKEDEDATMQQLSDFQTALSNGLHLVAFVGMEELKALSEDNDIYFESIADYTNAVATLGKDGKYEFPEWSNLRYLKASEAGELPALIPVSSEGTDLQKGEMILSASTFASLVRESYYALAEKANEAENWELSDAYYRRAELANEIEMGGKYVRDAKNEKDDFVEFTKEELAAKVKELVSNVKKDKVNLTLGLKLFSGNGQSSIGDLEAFGIKAVLPGWSFKGNRDIALVSDSDFDRLWDIQKATVDYYSTSTSLYTHPADAIYNILYLPYEKTDEVISSCWDIYSNEKADDKGVRIRLRGGFVDSLQTIDMLVKELSKVFLYVGLVFALFAALLFSNFISVSISYKKRDIGILRAVGARSTDVFKIFFSESFVIAAICTLLSSAASIVICSLLNKELANELGASVFVFGIASLAVLIGIALLTAIVATFLPVRNAARKKPVDSIRAI